MSATKGSVLTTEEQSAILALHRSGQDIPSIVDNVSRSESSVRRVIIRGRVREQPRNRGAKPKISNLLGRLIVRHARTGRYTARQLRDAYAPCITVRRVQQLLQNAPDMTWTRAVTAPPLTPSHRRRRLEWARQHVSKGEGFWRRVIFSDEKRFTLDGPDGLRSYWHDKRRAKRWHSTRQNGGGGLMVWGAISAHGKSELVFVTNRIDSARYIQVLENALVPFVDTHTRRVVFQQDGAPPHTAIATLSWLSDNDIDVLPWPSRSPDANPIENAWSALSRTVYENGKQFDNTEDLREAILTAWQNLSANYIRSLVRSVPTRCLKIIEARGGPSGY